MASLPTGVVWFPIGTRKSGSSRVSLGKPPTTSGEPVKKINLILLIK